MLAALLGGQQESDEAKSRWVSMASMPTAADEGPVASEEAQQDADVT